MSATVEIDLDDTAACPLAPTCEGVDCSATDDLAVATVRTVVGMFCMSLCAACCEQPLPAMRPLDALSRGCRHAEHLGIDVDLMAELLDAEDGPA